VKVNYSTLIVGLEVSIFYQMQTAAALSHRGDIPWNAGTTVVPEKGKVSWDTEPDVCRSPAEFYVHTVSDKPQSSPMTAGSGAEAVHVYKMSAIKKGALSLALRLIPGKCADISRVVDTGKGSQTVTWKVARGGSYHPNLPLHGKA
jgi:hypothetical protein